MEPMKMAAEAVTMQKNYFETMFDTISAFQDESEKIYLGWVDQMPWVPEEGKRAISNLGDQYKKARAQFKTTMDDGFNRFEATYCGK
jgi:hypothetical protein